MLGVAAAPDADEVDVSAPGVSVDVVAAEAGFASSGRSGSSISSAFGV